MDVVIRFLTRLGDFHIVRSFMAEVDDYYYLWRGRSANDGDVEIFFDQVPPGCNREDSCHLGLFLNGRLSGIAGLSFGFPALCDAYLLFLILAAHVRGRAYGPQLLHEAEEIARQKQCQNLYLAVLEANPAGRRFWMREGFAPTGITRMEDEDGIPHKLERLEKRLLG